MMTRRIDDVTLIIRGHHLNFNDLEQKKGVNTLKKKHEGKTTLNPPLWFRNCSKSFKWLKNALGRKWFEK